METKENIIISHACDGWGTGEWSGYVMHALCTDGRCSFLFNEQRYEANVSSFPMPMRDEPLPYTSITFSPRQMSATVGLMSLRKNSLVSFLNTKSFMSVSFNDIPIAKVC